MSAAVTANAVARYQSVKVTTSSPGQLVVMLYDGLLRFLGEAAEAITTGDRAKAGERIGRSHGIIEQLLTGLDPSHAPELAERLESVYIFCMHHLLEANLHQDRKRIEDVVRIVSPLRDAWATVVNGEATAASEQP